MSSHNIDPKPKLHVINHRAELFNNVMKELEMARNKNNYNSDDDELDELEFECSDVDIQVDTLSNHSINDSDDDSSSGYEIVGYEHVQEYKGHTGQDNDNNNDNDGMGHKCCKNDDVEAVYTNVENEFNYLQPVFEWLEIRKWEMGL